MAIIGKIREQSTLVLIIIGGAIMAFVLSDLFSSQGGGAQGPINVGLVNETPITPTEFELKVNQAYETYKLNTQTQGSLDEKTKSQIREQVWNEKLADILIGGQMEELGVDVTSKELFDMVQGNNPHPQIVQAFTDPNTGQFDKNAVIQFLQNLDNDPETKQRWLVFEKAIKRNQYFNKYNTLINKAYYMPSALAEKEYKEDNTTLNFMYVYKPFTALNDTAVQVTDQELQAYYKEHQDEYEQEASTKVLYAYFPVAPSELDNERAKRYMDEVKPRFEKAENDSLFVNANSDDPFDPRFYSIDQAPANADSALWNQEVGAMTDVFKVGDNYYLQKVTAIKMAPDSVNARHILINTQERSAERANELADSLKGAIEAGADFAELAMTYSDDVGSGQKGGDLDWFTEGMMVKPFNDAAFSAEVGDLIKVSTQFGVHLIEVKDQTEPKKKIQLAVVRRLAEAGKETYEEVFNKANSFSIEAQDIESFNSLVREKNVQRRVAVLGPDHVAFPNLEASRDIVRWVRDAKEGDVSEPYDTDEAFVVVVVENVSEKGVPPLEDVRGRIEYYTKQEKKAEMFKEEMAGATDLGSIAAKLSLSVQNAAGVSLANPTIDNVGFEPAVVGKAYTLESNQMSVPIKGNNGVFVVMLEQKSDPGPANLVAVRSSESRAIKARLDNGALLEALKEKAEIEDNRAKFY